MFRCFKIGSLHRRKFFFEVQSEPFSHWLQQKLTSEWSVRNEQSHERVNLNSRNKSKNITNKCKTQLIIHIDKTNKHQQTDSLVDVHWGCLVVQQQSLMNQVLWLWWLNKSSAFRSEPGCSNHYKWSFPFIS